MKCYRSTSHTGHTTDSSIILSDNRSTCVSCAQSRDLAFIIATGRLNWLQLARPENFDCRFSRGCSMNVEFANLRAKTRLIRIGQAHRRNSHKRALQQKKKRRTVHRKKARVSAKIGRDRRSQREDFPEDLTRPTVKLQLLARQWALPRISNQLLPRKLKLNVLSTHPTSPLPSATTTIAITTNIVVVVVDVERTPRVPAHGLQLRRALCE